MSANYSPVLRIVLLLVSFTTAEDLCHGSTPASESGELPWQDIAGVSVEDILTDMAADSSKGTDRSYTFGPGHSVSVRPGRLFGGDRKLPAECTFHIKRWRRESWDHIGTERIKLSSGQTIFLKKVSSTGFYKLVVANLDSTDKAAEESFYIIVCDNWKKDLLAFCRYGKEEIETHPDSHLLRSSVAVSHYDHVMELAAHSGVLSEKILSALGRALTAKRVHAEGDCPDFVVGSNNLRFKRFEGGKFAEFVLVVPDDYNPSDKWPVFIHIGAMHANYHFRANGAEGNTLDNKMLYLCWPSVTHEDMQWKDYAFVISIMRKKFNIDNDRIYLYGHCEGGIAAIALGLNRPDEWAECISFTGNSFRNLAGNAFNLSIKFGNVRKFMKNREILAYCRFMDKCFDYNNCRYIARSDLSSDIPNPHKWDVPQSKRISSPKRILFTMESLRSPRAYWITVLGREDENYAARIEASVDGQEIVLKRNNVDAYRIDLKLAPLDHTRPMAIIDNENSIAVAPKEVFTYRGGKYDKAKYVKDGQLHGPICDVFTDAYTVLYTKGFDAEEAEQIKRIANKIAGDGPCLPEDKLSDEIIRNHNLIFVGRAGRCEFLRRISDSLPVEIGEGKFIFENRRLTGDVGLMMVHPNPANPKKYVSLILGGSGAVVKRLPEILGNDVKKADADIAIFKIGPDDKHEFVRLERLNTVWDWHENWSEPLATVSEQYPKWRWQQWIAHAVRIQLGADIAVCEGVLEDVEKPSHKIITLRDLNLMLENKWIVKAKLNGNELKMLLTNPAAGKGPSVSKAKKPVIDGVSLVKGMGGPGYIHVSQIKDDQYYTVALPEKLINGSRIGEILEDYEIVGDGYLIEMIRDRLKSRKNSELDSELRKMKLTIM